MMERDQTLVLEVVGCDPDISSALSPVDPICEKKIIQELDNKAENCDDSANNVCSEIASSAGVSSIVSIPEYDINPDMPVSVIKEKIANIVSRKGSDMIQACRNFDRRSTNKINKYQLRQVLRTYCLPITAAQFDLLCNEVKMKTPGKINYADFFKKLSGGIDMQYEKKFEKLPDDLPIDEVELRMKEKIKSRLFDIVRAFWLFDVNKDGLVQKSELRRIIRNYCFELSDETFNDLWKTHDPKNRGVIPYKDFLIRLGINADRYKKYMPTDSVANAMCWSDNKAKSRMDEVSTDQRTRRAALENRDDPAIQGLPMEEIIALLRERMQSCQSLLWRALSVYGCGDSGDLVPLAHFHKAINFFVLALSPQLFNQLLKRLKVSILSGLTINVSDFVKALKNESRTSKNPQQSAKKKYDCHPVVQYIKNHVIDPCSRLQSVFTNITADGEWQVTRQELKKAIELGLQCRLSPDQYRDLSALLDPGNTNLINCKAFLKLFDGPCDTLCHGAQGDSEPKEADKKYDAQKYRGLSGKSLESRLSHHLTKNLKNIERGIYLFDPYQTGFIERGKMIRVLNEFCMPLTPAQFGELVKQFRLSGDRLCYKEFIDAYKEKPGTEAKKWRSTIEKVTRYKSRCDPELPGDEVRQLIGEAIRSRRSAILADLRSLDVCHVGVVGREDVRKVLDKYAFRLTDKQFNELWQDLPTNKYNQLLYEPFLDMFTTPSANQKAPKRGGPGFEPPSADKQEGAGEEERREENKEAEKGEVGKRKEALPSASPHLKTIFEPMEISIVRNYRAIRYELRRADVKNNGAVDLHELRRILLKYGIKLQKEDESHLLQHFGREGKVDYGLFLRHFVWHA